MDEDDYNDPISAMLIPEVSVNVDETPLELSDDVPIENHEVNGDSRLLEDESNKDDENADPDQENINPDQIPDAYTLEEVKVHEQLLGPGQRAVQFQRLHCTACKEHLGSAPSTQYKRFIHPLLKVLICKKCYEFYGSGDFEKDEDGSELYCRWCGQGGKVLCCAQCPFVFCQKCIRINLGKKTLAAIKDSEDWTCFACKPEQIINLRVICRGLYDYVQQEMRLAEELNDPERLKKDYSMCCSFNKPKPVIIKRKELESDIPDFCKPFLNSEDVFPLIKKRKKYPATLPTANEGDAKTWQTKDEDEVVCTPDLSLFMGDDGPSTNDTVPPLRPISPMKKAVKFIGETRVTHGAKPRAILPVPQFKLTTVPIVLNTSTHQPLTATSTLPNLGRLQTPPLLVRAPTISAPTVLTIRDNTLLKLKPGTKYEWFEKASKLTGSVNDALRSRLTALEQDQARATGIENLANIHNGLQEILSNSINTLMQIRKSLRGDFVAGLKQIKLDNEKKDSDDVIFVGANNVKQCPPTYIKVKPTKDLMDSSAVITIDDDKPEVAKKPSEPIVIDENSSSYMNTREALSEIEDTADPETLFQIKRAMLESRFESIVHDNMKYKVENISEKELKMMLNVRVVVSPEFGKNNLRTHPVKGYKAMNRKIERPKTQIEDSNSVDADKNEKEKDDSDSVDADKNEKKNNSDSVDTDKTDKKNYDSGSVNADKNEKENDDECDSVNEDQAEKNDKESGEYENSDSEANIDEATKNEEIDKNTKDSDKDEIEENEEIDERSETNEDIKQSEDDDNKDEEVNQNSVIEEDFVETRSDEDNETSKEEGGGKEDGPPIDSGIEVDGEHSLSNGDKS